MKGPSLDAIRKFKQQQEQKKREEDERKVQEKLTTLEHRAAQGDRKAKVQLKKIEQVQETKHDNNNQLCNTKSNSRGFNNSSGQINNNNTASSGNTNKNTVAKKCKPKDVETDFEELMRLAKNNTNEVKTQEKPKEKIDKIVLKRSNEAARAPPPDTNRRMPASRVDAQLAPMKSRVEPKSMPSTSKNLSRPQQHMPPRQTPHVSSRPAQHLPSRPAQHLPSRPPQHLPSRPPQHLRTNLPPRAIPAPSNRYRLPARHAYEDDDEDDYDDEDEYESDGFIVNEDDDEVREELSKTLKDVFRYDKRRCDLREQEVDRQYRAIGNVSTFEDLEREERRASRLAAAEDARELREEEERKRLKKIRLKGK